MVFPFECKLNVGCSLFLFRQAGQTATAKTGKLRPAKTRQTAAGAAEARFLVVAVDDPMFTENCGSWSLSRAGAARTEAVADVDVGIETLSAAYLGAVSWNDLAAIGGVSASNELLDRLDALFAVRPSPFCATGY